MITQIGIIAGDILNLIEKYRRPLSVTEIRRLLKSPVSLINMGIGWLIREQCVVVIAKDGHNYLHEFKQKKTYSMSRKRTR